MIAQKIILLLFVCFSSFSQEKNGSLEKNNTGSELINLAQKEGDMYQMSQDYYDRATSYLLKKDYYNAFTNFELSLNGYNSLDYDVSSEKASILFSIANIYGEIGDYENALINLNEGVDVIEESKIEFNFGSVYVLYGNIYKAIKNNEKAIFYYTKAEEELLKKADNYQLVLCYLNQALLHIENHNVDLAKLKVDKAISKNTFKENTAYSALIYYIKALINYKQNQLQKAKQNADLAYAFAKQNRENIKVINDVVKLLFDVNKDLNASNEVSKYSNLYVKYKDSIMSLENSKRFYREQISFEVSKIQLETAKEIEKANELKIRKSKTYRSFLSIIIPIIVFLIIFLILKDKRLVKFKTKELLVYNEKQNLQEEIEQIENTVTQDLYDNFSKRLKSIGSAYDIIKDLNSKKQFSHPLLSKFGKLIENNLLPLTHDIRDMLWASNTDNNDLHKIISKIREIIKNANLDIKINLTSGNINNDEIYLPKSSHKHLLFIIKEAIHNAIKHSKTNKIDIEINISKTNFLELTITDFGVGFDMKDTKRINGIDNMKKRASLINFDFNLTSNIKGTTITLKSKEALVSSPKNIKVNKNVTQIA